MSETKEKLLERIADLEAELRKYKAIAATYRGALGDVKANTILTPLFRLQQQEDRNERNWKPCTKEAK